MSWDLTELGNLITIKHGYAFKGKHFANEGEYILLTPGNFNEQGGLKLKGEKEKYYTGDFPEQYLLKAGDLIVVMTDLINTAPILGGSAIVPEDNKFLHNQRLGLVEIKDKKRIDKKFLYYLFNIEQYRGQVRGSATGATVRHTAPERIYRSKLRIPNRLETQRRIASILSAYDDLIENNLRRISLLEESARLLYKEWFVLVRFPGCEHTRIINGVPQGWEKKTVGQLAQSITRGITPHYDDDAENIVINQKCIRNGRIDLNLARRHKNEAPTLRLVQLGDVLVNSTGEGTLGRVAQVRKAIPGCATDSHVTIARPNAMIRRWYFGFAVTHLEPILSTLGRGATNQTELSRTTISEMKILHPSTLIMNEFEEVVEPVVLQIEILTSQNGRLRQARELMLPKLMSGEVEV